VCRESLQSWGRRQVVGCWLAQTTNDPIDHKPHQTQHNKQQTQQQHAHLDNGVWIAHAAQALDASESTRTAAADATKRQRLRYIATCVWLVRPTTTITTTTTTATTTTPPPPHRPRALQIIRGAEAGPQRAANTRRTSRIARMHRRAQRKAAAIGQRHGCAIVVVGDAHYAQHWAEDFVLRNRHRWRYVDQQRWLEKLTLFDVCV
jgi:hypothetical protein